MLGYSISHNVLLNINTTRYKLYQQIIKNTSNKKNFTEEELISYGLKSGFTRNMSRDEIIGCLYANFLIKTDDNNYIITERALMDFSRYKSDAKHKLNELPITIDFTKDYIRLLIQPVETMDENTIQAFIKLGWSRNKSKITLIKKVRDYELIGTELNKIIPIGCKRNYNSYTDLTDIITTFGRQRKRLNDYTININYRGVYSSNTLLKYLNTYIELFKYIGNPIDWGGQGFDPFEIPNNKEEFLIDGINDGMLRKLTMIEAERYKKQYSITGHAHTIISSYLWKYHEKRISIVIRPSNDNKYVLLLGENTEYSKIIKDYIEEYFEKYDFGWYIKNSMDIDKLLKVIVEISSLFVTYYNYKLF